MRNQLKAKQTCQQCQQVCSFQAMI